jgi:hypothetical protein
MTRSHKVVFRKYQSKEMCITNFVLGEEVTMFRHGMEVTVKLIKTSAQGYNLLMINTHSCVFPSARVPCSYIQYQKKGTIPIAHIPGYIFQQQSES